jgi:undecaprenyl pyrophosphate synthase
MTTRIAGPVDAFYTRRLRRQVMAGPLPRHVGLIMDAGPARWAVSPSLGHQRGARHVEEVLSYLQLRGRRDKQLRASSVPRTGLFEPGVATPHGRTPWTA